MSAISAALAVALLAGCAEPDGRPDYSNGGDVDNTILDEEFASVVGMVVAASLALWSSALRGSVPA